MKRESRGYRVWSETEEQALREGVKRYGVGSWETIRQDKSFTVLRQRSGVQLKDKWRNMVKFRKLSGSEFQNLPRRMTGPWSKKSESVRSRSTVRRNHHNEDRRYGIYDSRRYIRSASSEDSDMSTHEYDNCIVACRCGVDYDDGERMIECEKCKEWAHVSCLDYNVDNHYVCDKCRSETANRSNQRAQETNLLFDTAASLGGISVTTAACMLSKLLEVRYEITCDSNHSPAYTAIHNSNVHSSTCSGI